MMWYPDGRAARVVIEKRLRSAVHIVKLRFIFSPEKKCNALPGPPGKAETSVARTAAGIGEALPCFGNELPVEGVGPQGELQDAKGCRIAQLAVGLRKAERAVILATGANDEFANAALGVCGAVWSLRSEALIIMIVAADNHV